MYHRTILLYIFFPHLFLLFYFHLVLAGDLHFTTRKPIERIILEPKKNREFNGERHTIHFFYFNYTIIHRFGVCVCVFVSRNGIVQLILTCKFSNFQKVMQYWNAGWKCAFGFKCVWYMVNWLDDVRVQKMKIGVNFSFACIWIAIHWRYGSWNCSHEIRHCLDTIVRPISQHWDEYRVHWQKTNCRIA